jgi:hypothetical protein
MHIIAAGGHTCRHLILICVNTDLLIHIIDNMFMCVCVFGGGGVDTPGLSTSDYVEFGWL